MSVFSRLTGWFGNNTATSSYLTDIGGTFSSTQDARNNLPAVLRGINLLSSDVGRIGVECCRSDGTYCDCPAMTLLAGEANPYMSGHAWRAWMVASAIANGCAYSFIQRDNRGDPVALYPLLPGRIAVIWFGFEPKWLMDGKEIDPFNVAQLMSGAGSMQNPYTCLSPLARCAPSLSLAILQERVATALAESGRVGKISITHPGTLSTTAKLDLISGYISKHVSPEGSTRPLVLDEGVRVERVGDGALPGLLEDRKFQIMEIARALGIPPQMLYQSDAGSLNSQIEMQRQYVEGTVAGWCDRFATSLSSKLLPQGCKLKFEVEDLTRGNLRDVAAALKDLAMTGSITINDAREMLGLPIVADGDVALTPAATSPTSGVSAPQFPPEEMNNDD